MKNTTIVSASGYGKNLKYWRTRLYALFATLCVSLAFGQTGYVNIGSGTATGASLVPINSCYGYNYSQQIVTASEFAAGGGVAGPITSLKYYYSSGGTTIANWNNWTVYVGHTTKTTFASNTDWEPQSSLTQVFTGTITPVAGNWFEITFSTPFTYNGTSNLIIAVDENVANWSCTAAFGSYTSGSNTGIYYRNDTTNPDPASPPTATGRTATLPRIQLMGNVASCLAPTNLVATTAGFTTGSATWTASQSAPGLGYEYYISSSNTAPTATTTPTGTVGAGVTTASFTGLTANTTYYVWVRSSCTATDKSSWAGSSFFYTGYCTPAPTSQDGTGITNFTMGTINNTTGSETGYYGNYSAQSSSHSLGSTVNFSVTYATGFTYGTKIWIDFNNDADFDDTGEQVYYGLSTNANPTTLAGSFVVPATAALGSHRLRVGGIDTDTGGTPCYTGSYGSYEDYTIDLFMPPAPVVTGFTPASYCAASGVITITGTDLLNATVSIGGTAITPLTTNTNTVITASVPSGVSGTVTVTTIAGSSTSTGSFNVTAPATFTLSGTAATICNGSSTSAFTITQGASSFDTYVWSPATGVTGSAATGWTFNPTATTEYVLTASSSTGPCVVNATVAVTVNTAPTAVTVTPSATATCLGEPVALNGTGGYVYVPLTYCSPTVTNTGASGDYLNNFSFAGIVNNNSGDAASDYTYYSALTGNVTVGTPYTISLQSGNATWSQYFRVWIDYDQNGTFEDSESVFNTTTSATSATVMTGTITVPSTAYSGTTRMRVLCSYNSLSAATNDCSWSGFGEYEDYNVTITGGSYPNGTFVWTPATGLYTNAAGTVPYVAGTTAAMVYAMPDATTTYTATASTTLGCTASNTATVTVNVTPAPTAVSPQNFTSLTYVSDLEATGTDIMWYTSATGGTALAATDAVWTGTYYASQTLNGCESQTRAAVAVSVILPEMDWVNLQWPPVLSIVEGATGDVYAQGYEPGVTPGAGPGYGVLAWVGVSSSNTNPSTWTTWVPMTFNTQVSNNDEYVAAIGDDLTPGTYYYATRFKLVDGPFVYGGYSATGGGIWDGSANVSGVLTVTCGTAAPEAAAAQAFCNAATVADLEATGTSVQWYTAATGGTALSANAALVNGTTYYASQTVGCESLTRTAVVVTVTTTPAPTAAAAQSFTADATVADIAVSGTAIVWYTDATGGTVVDGSTALEDGVTYYASQTANGCESPERVAVTASIVAYTLDFVNLQWPAEISVIEGSNAAVYAQVYEPSVTPGAGPGVGITVMVGISTENTDPSTWTTWIPMTFNTQVGNNDEFMAQIGANLAPGTYYYAVAGQLYEGPYVYGGYSANGGGTWDGTTNVSGVINVICYTAAPWALEVQQVLCGSATVASLTAEGSSIQWYAAAEGGEPLALDTELVDGMVYYATQTVNGCESPARVAVTAYISVVSAPTGDAEQQLEYDYATVVTIDDIVVEANGYVTWYYTEADAIVGTNPIAEGTEIASGTYYAVASYGDCTSAPLAVTVETVLGGEHFDMASFKYWPNPVSDVLTVSYSQDITSVNVYNLIGQQVLTLAPNAAEVKINMSGLAEGTYTVQVSTGNSTETIKVVKKQ
jgi:large repetitive protein